MIHSTIVHRIKKTNKLNFFFTKKIQLAILKIKDLYFIWQNFSGKMFGS